MRNFAPSRLRAIVTASLAAVALVIGGVAFAAPASADSAPVDPTNPSTPTTVTADALPTPQIDGVVWTQKVVGNIVYAGGNWSTVRPYGSAAGVNTTAQPDILAYNLTTGALITTFNPQLNGQVKSIAFSPDNSVMYIGGAFTTVNGTSAYRLAALNPTTGALIKTFSVTPNATVNAVATSGSTVYFGGNFSGVGSSVRTYAAAVTSTGTLLPWAPSIAGGSVAAIAVDPDGSKVVVGGQFTTVNGSGNPGYGLAAVNPTSGASMTWNVNSVVQDGGNNAGITSLTADTTGLYGSGFVFGAGGNVEGSFRADWANGDLTWLESCHGDTYSTAVTNDAAYIAGHPHYCGDVGGFPQTEPTWTFHRALAFSLAATQKTTPDPYTPSYADFTGQPAPSLLNWYPDFNTGTFTGQSQGPWSVAAASNSQYVVYGGEFTTVNGTAQQGLTRFAVSSLSTNKQGPMVTGANFKPSVISLSNGTARVSWTANWDRDNQTLTYNVYRNGGATPVYTTTAASTFWNQPNMGFVDKGLTPGSSVTYRVSATDPSGNVVKGDSSTAVTITSSAPSNFVSTVAAQGASSLWRFNEASGTTAYDNVGFNDMVSYGGLTGGQAGSASDGSNSSAFNGQTNGYAATKSPIAGPQTFSVSAWIKTTTTAGGVIAGFGDQNATTSSNYDRRLYMDTSGTVYFGVYDGNTEVLSSPTPLNDGKWHQVTGTLSSAGMTYFVDGRQVGSNPNVTTAQTYNGYWRVGGDSAWSGAPFFAGNIDDVSVYPTALGRSQVDAEWVAAGNPTTIASAPKDAYGSQVFTDSPYLYYRLDDAAGSTTAKDYSFSGSNGVYTGGVTQGTPGALANNSDTAATFDGQTGQVDSVQSYNDPETYTEEAWFKTTTTTGGKILGFGSSPTGTSGSYDRHIYMQDDGQLVFGVWTGQENTVTTPGSYNDGAWHAVVAEQSSAGLALYVDGKLIGTNPDTQAQAYTGYWKVGGDTTWGSSSSYFAGSIDEVAVYDHALSASTIATHYALGSGSTQATPTSSFTATPTFLSVAFDGTGSSEKGGSIASYSWAFGDGATSTSATPSHTYASAGTYTVSLTVTDANGITATSSQQVTVAAAIAPTASFTSTPTNLSVEFDASASTAPSGTITSYAWNFGDGATGTGSKPTHVYSTAGTYTVTLTVTDSNGKTGTATASVTVTKALVPPTAAFTATPTGLSTAFDGTSSSDPNTQGSITSYAWNFGDGATATGSKPTHVYTAAGTYTVALTVTDNNGLTGVASQSVTVSKPAVPPTASFTSTSTGLALSVDGSGSTAGTSAISSYAWNFGDSGTATGSTATHTYAAAGTYTVTLTVTDAAGQTGTSTSTVTVSKANIAPTASFTQSANGLVLSVDGSGSTDPDGSVAGYAWSFGDGATATTAKASHTYAAAGSYTVKLTVTDNQGATGTSTQVVTVAALTPPTASFTATVSGLGVSTDASASAATASGATISSYAWTFGDSGTATGKTASHTYAAGGTYTVTLKVTDSNGLSTSATQSVTVQSAATQPFALDTFNRSVTGGWGTATTGGAWTKAGTASNLSVSGNAGNLSLPTAGTQIASYLYSPNQTSSNLLFSFTLAKAPTGGGTYVSAIPRAISTNNEYRAQVRLQSTGAVGLSLLGYNGSSTATTLVAEKTITGLTAAAGTSYSVRVEAVGTSPTTIRARVWVTGTTEPTTWQETVTDSSSALQVGGGVGALAYLSGSSTNAPQTVSVSQLSAVTAP